MKNGKKPNIEMIRLLKLPFDDFIE